MVDLPGNICLTKFFSLLYYSGKTWIYQWLESRIINDSYSTQFTIISKLEIYSIVINKFFSLNFYEHFLKNLRSIFIFFVYDTFLFCYHRERISFSKNVTVNKFLKRIIITFTKWNWGDPTKFEKIIISKLEVWKFD